jgi:HAMP domain-containing protein
MNRIIQHRIEKAIEALTTLADTIEAIDPSKPVPNDITQELARIEERLANASLNTELDAMHLLKLMAAKPEPTARPVVAKKVKTKGAAK